MTDIRNWIGDIASGKIKDQRIALSKEEALAFERELNKAVSENELLLSSNNELSLENKDLKTRLEELEGVKDLPQEQESILKFLSQQDGSVYGKSLISSVSLDNADGKFHLGELLANKLIYSKVRRSIPTRTRLVNRGVSTSQGSPAGIYYGINQDGRRYLANKKR